MHAHVVIVTQDSQVVDVWSGEDETPLTRQQAEEMAHWGNLVPGNERWHQAVSIEVPEVIPA